MPPKKAKSELKSVGIDAQKNYPPLDCKEERSALSTNTHSEQWSEINKEQILEDLEEKLNESALDIHNDSMLSTSSAFSKDLIEACANASAEMLDLHLTPYDLKSVHEYQISNDKKLSELLLLLKNVVLENSQLKETISTIQSEIKILNSKIHLLENITPSKSSEILNTTPQNSSSVADDITDDSRFSSAAAGQVNTVLNKDFPSLQESLKMKPQPKLRGWAIASACLPSLNPPREDRIIQSSILEVSGNIPEGSSTEIILALVQKFNEDLCPMLNGLGRDLTSADITHILHKKSNHSQNMLVVRFSNQSTKDFVFKNRKLLHSTGKTPLFLSPHLSLEDSRNQQKIMKVFKSFRSKHGDHYNFSIFAQGHFIKILSQGARHFYAFDSHLSPKEFLVSKGIIVE